MSVTIERGYLMGVDLGQANDYTAVAVIQRRETLSLTNRYDEQISAEQILAGSRSPLIKPGTIKGRSSSYDVVHLDRLPLGTPYPLIVEEIRRLLAHPNLAFGTRLVVDATGVGRPVVDAMRASGLKPVPITITAGSAVTAGPAGYKRVPKADIVGTIAVLLQSSRLRIAEELHHAHTLVDELAAFQVRATAAGNDSYGSWRESVHDDLVLALGIALWQAERAQEHNPAEWGARRY